MPSPPAREQHLRELVDRLDLRQQVRLLTGADLWSLHAAPVVGLRTLVVSDGPAGVRGRAWDEREPSANVPSPTALAATWDPPRVERIGRLLAAEARRKGVDVLLAPTVNLHRSPFAGRHFECFSEDPWLTAVVGTAFVRGVQAGGVGATVKHLVANDSETERFTVDVRIDERTLHELYLAPFEDIVRDGQPWAVMAAYNGVGGHTMTGSPLLRDVLKGAWGWDGVVVSDWFAARSLAAAGEGLLDLVMPGPFGPWGDALVDAVEAGRVSRSGVEDKVLRLLRLAGRVGALDSVGPAPADDRPSDDPDLVRAELRAAAAAGAVLVRNERAALPIDLAASSRIAVLGPNARTARTLGGGSATVIPPVSVSPLEGIAAAVDGRAELHHGVGVRASERVPTVPLTQLTVPGGTARGVEVRYLDAGGDVVATETRASSALLWGMGSTPEAVTLDGVAALEVRCGYRPVAGGRHHLGGAGLGRLELWVDGDAVIDAELALPAASDAVEVMMRPPQATTVVELEADRDVEVVLRLTPPSADDGQLGLVVCHLLADTARDDDELLAEAVALARDADVAVVVVGTTEEVESEGFDRVSLALPGRQDELVRRVAAVNERTVVVVNAGAPVLLPWADDVAAVLLAWFPGQEFGHALADVLFGAVEPGGRLPTTWPRDEGDPPSVTPVDGVLAYTEGLAVGYRADGGVGPAVRYPFGHGLGFTTWRYGEVGAPAEVAAGATVSVTVDVRNTGDRAGGEVVQVYASRPDGEVPRPPRWLVGWAVVDAAAGERVDVTVDLSPRAFSHWEPGVGWSVEPGTFHLEVGRSVADLRSSTEVTVTG